MTPGDLTSLFSYIMALLMSLMMLSMVVVMISMSLASIRRISEVLVETPDLHDPENPVTEVPDGSIDFDHVNFSYKHGSGKNACPTLTCTSVPARPSASSAAPARANPAW